MSTKIKNFLKFTLECAAQGVIIGIIVAVIDRIWG